MARENGSRLFRRNATRWSFKQNYIAEFLEARAYLSTVVFPAKPPAFAIASGPTSTYPAVADFNGDGIPDIADANSSLSGQDGTISVLPGKGGGSFGSVQTLPAGQRPYQVIAGVFTSSGHEDLVVTNTEDGTVGFYAGQGNGSFAAPVSSSYGSANNIGGDTVSVAAADVNGDGKLDLIITGAIITSDNPENQMVIMLGNGDGTFTVKQTLPGIFDTIVTGNFLGSGHVDIATGLNSQAVVDVFGGNGDGTFSATPLQLHVGIVGDESQGAGLASGDFNGDGKPDLVLVTGSISQPTPDTLTVFLSQGNGTFGSAINMALPFLPSDVAVGDFDGDGKLDVLGTSGQNLVVYLGNGDGNFQTTPAFDLENFSTSGAGGPTVADLNGDGKPDIVVVGGNSNVVGNVISVLINGQSGGGGGGGGGGSTGTLAPSISGKIPSSVIAGQKAAINETLAIAASGGAYNATSTSKLFLSTGTSVDGSSIQIGSTITKTLKLKSGAHATFKFSLKSLPSSVPNGTYHLVAQVTDSSANTSTAASSGTITVAPPEVNLKVSLAKFASAAKGGKKFTETLGIANSGNIPAVGTVPIEVFTSPDGLQADATLLATIPRKLNIKNGKSQSVPLSLTAPASGTSAFLIFEVDPSATLKETTPANDTVVSPSAVTFS
jgi:hypothetical protein